MIKSRSRSDSLRVNRKNKIGYAETLVDSSRPLNFRFSRSNTVPRQCDGAHIYASVLRLPRFHARTVIQQ